MKMLYGILLAGLLAANPALAQVEKGETAVYDAGTGAERSRLRYEYVKSEGRDKKLRFLEAEGKGAYDRFKNVTWHQEAVFEEKNGLIFVQSTRCLIRDRAGKILAGFEKTFDYARGELIWISTDAGGNIVRKVKFPLKGMTTDDIGLIYFLRPFAERDKDPAFKIFYLVSNEPNIYKTKIRMLGREVLNLPAGQKRALKFKLTGDVGVLEYVLDRFVPRTFIWFDETSPHDWLQYQGFETDMRSPYVRGMIVKRTFQDR